MNEEEKERWRKEVEKFRAENEAFRDWADRVARDDPDWGLYMPGEPRPVLPWWRRVLKI